MDIRFPISLWRLLVSHRAAFVTTVTASVSAPEQPDIYVNSQSLPIGTIGVNYGPAPISYSGGTPPVRWDNVGGTTGGINFGADGRLTGAPVAAGTHTFIAKVTDANDKTDTEVFSISVAEAMSITSASLPQGIVGTSYSYTFTATGGVLPYTFTDNNNRPSGLTLSSTGVLSGVPDTAQTVTIGVTVTDAEGRTGTASFSITIAQAIAITTPSINPATNGVAFTQTLSATGQSGTYSWTKTGGPSWLSLSGSGVLSGTPDATGSSTFTVTARDSNSDNTGTRQYTITVSPAAIEIVTSTLGYATVGEDYSRQISVSGGSAPYFYSNTTSPLPPGLIIGTDTGLISGRPTSALAATPTIQVTDSQSTPYTVSKTLSLRAADPVVVTTTTLPAATVGTSYSQSINTSGGYGTKTFDIFSGALPAGLSLSSLGVISGVPTTSGGAVFRVRCTDSEGRTGLRTLTLAVNSVVSIQTSSPLADGTVGNAYTALVSVSGGSPPYSYSLVSTSGVPIPSWVSITSSTSAGCTVFGTPTGTAGFVNLIVRVADTAGSSDQRQYAVYLTTSAATPITILTSSLPNAIAGNVYVAPALQATGGTAPYQWYVLSASAPNGVTLTSATGIFSGTPTSAGSYTFEVRARDAVAATDTQRLTIVVSASAAPVTGNNWTYRSTLSGVTMKTRFDTEGEVTNYAWQGSAWDNHQEWFKWVNPTTNGINATTDDANLIPTGANGVMRFTVAHDVNDVPCNWNRHLIDSHGNATPLEYYEGFREGDEFWIYVRFLVPKYLTESRWSHSNGTGGWKIFIVDRLDGSSNPGETFINNASYRDFIQMSYSVGAGTLTTNTSTPCLASDIVYQTAINHTNSNSHPAGLDPNTGTACERSRKSRGGQYSYTLSNRTEDAYYTVPTNGNPRGSDQSSGGHMWRRDCADKWTGILMHYKIGNWGQANSTWEVWHHLEGDNYQRLGGRNNINLPRFSSPISHGQDPSFAYHWPTTGPYSPTSSPDGAWPINSLWLLGAQNTNKLANTNDHPSGDVDTYIYFSEVIVREGANGIPAPGFTIPPQSGFANPSYIPSTAGEVAKLTSVSNGSDTITDVITGEWDNAAGEDVFDPWCGGAWDQVNNVLWWNGGGHTDSSNNALFRFDFGAATQAVGWTRVDGSTVASVRPGTSQNGNTYSDGKWVSVHTYSGMATTPDGRVWRFGGSRYSDGSMGNHLWAFNPTTNSYTNYGNPGFGSSDATGPVLDYDYIRNLLLVYLPGAGVYGVFDPSTNTWATGSRTTSTNNAGGNNTGCFGYYNGQTYFISIGQSNSGNRRIWQFNGSQLINPSTGSTSTGAVLTANGATGSGVIQTAHSPAVAWDLEDNCFWGWDGHSTNTSARSTIYRGVFTSTTNIDWTPYNLTGTAISTAGDLPTGGYRKLGVLAGLDALAIINGADDAMYVIRKPV